MRDGRRPPVGLPALRAQAVRASEAGDHQTARRLLAQALGERPDEPDLWCTLAVAEARAGRPVAARQAVERCLSLAPNHALALLTRARLLEEQGDPAAALADLRRAAEAAPTRAEPWRRAARLLRRQGDLAAAAVAYERACARAADDLLLRREAAETYATQGRHRDAARHWRVLAEAHPDRWEGWHLLGVALSNALCFEQAEQALRRALALGGAPETAASLARLYERLGRTEEAHRLLAPHLARHPHRPSVALARATLAGSEEERREAVAALRRCLQGDLPREQRAMVHRRLAQLLDGLGQHADAWEHLQEASRLAWQGFDPAREEALCRWIRTHFPLPGGAPTAPSAPALVLIVGMPRSGTTLLERMLAAHPKVHGAGEQLTLPELGRRLYAESLSTGRPPKALLGPTRLEAWQRRYLDRALRDAAGRPAVIVDKMPENYRWLGLARLLFPQARVLHIMRHPLDTCLSCHLTGLHGIFDYSRSLEGLAAAYHGYRQLMAHWEARRTLPLLTLRYEELVTAAEAVLRRVLAFLGLPWDPACLDFPARAGVVRTASYRQVRRPLYRSAIGRWRPYAARLEPLRRALAPYLDEAAPYGYR